MSEMRHITAPTPSQVLPRRSAKPGVTGPAAIVGGRARLTSRPPSAALPPATEPASRPVSVGPTGRAQRL